MLGVTGSDGGSDGPVTNCYISSEKLILGSQINLSNNDLPIASDKATK